jgi:hypothetical protein
VRLSVSDGDDDNGVSIGDSVTDGVLNVGSGTIIVAIASFEEGEATIEVIDEVGCGRGCS